MANKPSIFRFADIEVREREFSLVKAGETLPVGSDGPILYAGNMELEQPLLKGAKLQGPEVSDARRAFAALPPQDMRLGSRMFGNFSS